MSYTKNEVALETLISNINKYFYYIGEDDDIIPNPVDLCRILNYNLNGKVLGYNVKFDDIIPYNGEDSND